MGDRMRKAKSVANYIIAYALKIGHPISNLQLQKILYYIQVHFLKNTGVPFFKDDIEAWLIGPVIPNVYYQYAVFGPAPITIFNETDMDLDSKEQKELNQMLEMLSPKKQWNYMDDNNQIRLQDFSARLPAKFLYISEGKTSQREKTKQ